MGERIRQLFMLMPQRGGRDRSTDYALGEILKEIRKGFRQVQQQIADAFAALQAEVQSVRDTENAALNLINGLQTQLNQALNSSMDPQEIVNAVQAVTSQLSTDAAGLAAAVVTPPPSDTSGSSSDTSSSDTSSSDTSGADTSGTSTNESGGDATDPTAGQ